MNSPNTNSECVGLAFQGEALKGIRQDSEICDFALDSTYVKFALSISAAITTAIEHVTTDDNLLVEVKNKDTVLARFDLSAILKRQRELEATAILRAILPQDPNPTKDGLGPASP